MRLLTITAILIAGALATGLAVVRPAQAQTDAAWQRERAAAIQREQDARRDSLAFQQEQRARDQRARTDATLRSMQSGELAGGPSTSLPAYRPSAIAPMEPPRTTTPIPPNADQARMDALMADALARSNARVKAVTPGGNR